MVGKCVMIGSQRVSERQSLVIQMLFYTGLATFESLLLLSNLKVFGESVCHPSSNSGSDVGIWTSRCQQQLCGI